MFDYRYINILSLRMRIFFLIVLFLSFCTNAFTQIINGKDNIPQYNPQQIQVDNPENKSTKPTQSKTNTHFNKDTATNTNRTNIVQIGAGGLLTSSNFFRNDQQSTLRPAFSARLYYQPNGFFRLLFDYSIVEKENIIPTWTNVRNSFYDIDAHFLMHFNNINRGLIYFILGATSQSWKGYYTGIDDINYAKDEKIQPNTNYKAIYYGANIGIGLEFKIFSHLDAYGEVRFRVMDTDVAFGLSDVCFGVGLKYTLIDFNPKVPHKKPSKHFKWF
jgi:hypothetical protein